MSTTRPRALLAATLLAATTALLAATAGPAAAADPTPTPTPTATADPTPTPSAAPACQVAYRTGSEWAGGFIAGVTVTNTGTTPVDGWVLAFPFGGDQQITTAWHATVAQAGADVTLTAAQWNKRIPPGGKVTAGFLGTWTTNDAPPQRATLNGSVCTLA